MRNAVLVMIALCVLASRCAAEKVTVDPNAANVGAQNESKLSDYDARLAKNVIARVMKFKWRWEAKGGVRTYRLIMDRKTIMDAESKKRRSPPSPSISFRRTSMTIQYWEQWAVEGSCMRPASRCGSMRT